MKVRKPKDSNNTLKFSLLLAGGILLVGAVLSLTLYVAIQKSFFQATVGHETELTRVIEALGCRVIDSKLHALKQDARDSARQVAPSLTGGAEDVEGLLTALPLKDHQYNYCYQTRQALFRGRQFNGDYLADLDLSQAWAGETLLFSPDFDGEDNYILVVATPVWQGDLSGEIAGILIEQYDGYCLSQWLADLFLPLHFGTSYLIDETGRNIATAREENYDWITTRYNAQELVLTQDDESTRTVAKLEKAALDGKTGLDTYIWEGQTSYVAYGPLQEANWGFFVGFYGELFGNYTQTITEIGTGAAVASLAVFILFSGTIIAVIRRNLTKERRSNQLLLQQKREIEQQALRIAASEERFRIAMQRSQDVILECQLETGQLTCFQMGQERKIGRVGDQAVAHRMVEGFSMDAESLLRFNDVMETIGHRLTSAECLISGTHQEEPRWYSMSVSAVPNGTQPSTRAVGVFRDVTGEREAELDSLTRLRNKAAMTEVVSHAMANNAPDTACAFLMLDVDHFKQINDRYGHPVGDQVLSAVAERLEAAFPLPYWTGRFGGDEFSVYCPARADLAEIKGRLETLSREVAKLQGTEGKPLGITLSVGVSLFQGPASFETIYQKADAMLYAAKQAGRDCYRVSQDLGNQTFPD